MDLHTSKSYNSNIISKNLLVNGLNISTGTYLGMRSENQDNITIEYLNEQNIFILCDGHGGSYLSKRIPNLIVDKFLKNVDFTDEIIVKNVFKEIDTYLYKEYFLENNRREGTTCTIILITSNKIIGINLGDSSYLINSYDKFYYPIIHRPNNKVEISRILESGHKIMKVGKDFRIDGRLALSRSFGDYTYKIKDRKFDNVDSAVSCIPSISNFEKDFDFIVLGSDGFWDYIDKKRVISYLKLSIRNKSTDILVTELIKQAVNNGSKDNVSLIVIKQCGK